MSLLIIISIVSLGVAVNAYPLTNDTVDPSNFYVYADSSSRLVGANDAAPGSAPHMVAMVQGANLRSLVCGGSLISDRHVLTAAHCIDVVYHINGLTSTLAVIVGTNTFESGGHSYGLASNVTHPEWDTVLIKHDIGILVTITRVILSLLVKPIHVSSENVGGGVPAVVTGWGRLGLWGLLPTNLQELITVTLDALQCVHDVKQAALDLNGWAPPVDPTIEICTFIAQGKGNCHGDSGSALYRKDNGKQIGIVSWGFPCAVGAPDVFVRVSPYAEWMSLILNNSLE